MDRLYLVQTKTSKTVSDFHELYQNARPSRHVEFWSTETVLTLRPTHRPD